MADRIPLAGISDPELERRLTDLGAHLFPATPDLASRVRHQLENEARFIPSPSPQERPSSPTLLPSERGEGSTPRTHGKPLSLRTGPGTLWVAVGVRVAWLAAILLLLIAGGLALFPDARNAIADRLGLQGVLIRWVDEVPTPEPSRVGAPLLLGRPVTFDEAQATVDFPVLVPTASGFATPAEIYVLDHDEGAMISFVYPAGPELPTTDETGVGALLTQFQGAAERNLIEKGLRDDKGEMETRLQSVTVGGEPGFWISGAPHGFFFVCYDAGECREERYRLAGNVLLWEQDGLTLRLESALSLDDALTIAESVRAPD